MLFLRSSFPPWWRFTAGAWIMKISSVTILICTYNRALMLHETLVTMQEMTAPPGCDVTSSSSTTTRATTRRAWSGMPRRARATR